MNAENIYNYWKNNIDDAELFAELESIKNNPSEINDRFSKTLKFGTAGLRAVMGAGINRMNIYTVRLASQAFANYLKKQHGNHCSVVISFDSRKNSKKFAMETAKVMAGNNIKVYITNELAPTPFLSFAVRSLKACAGVMVTASHNTAEYNGYKCYGSDGAQISENPAEEIYQNMCNLDIFNNVKIMDFQQGINSGYISSIEDDVYLSYFNAVLSQRINKTSLKNLKVVYTPLNGAGCKMVEHVLKKSGIENLYIVKEQKEPDENFTTCRYPNPEMKSAFSKALEIPEAKSADLIIATDPDADRVGVCISGGNDFKLLSGNEIGIVLFHYIISQKFENQLLPRCPVLIKTIVSTRMVNEIAEEYNCEVREVLTGFKNIASEILKLENLNEENRYMFGFEESNGYLAGTYARDKDAISATLTLCEVAAYCKQNGMNLLDYLNRLYEKYGFYGQKTLSFEFKDFSGKEKIQGIMGDLRANGTNAFSNLKILKFEDCLKSKFFTDVLIYYIDEENMVIVRPSGTEPKIKFYIMCKAPNSELLKVKMGNIESSVNITVKKYMQ